MTTRTSEAGPPFPRELLDGLFLGDERHPEPLPARVRTLHALLQWRAERQPDQLAFTFLADGEGQTLHRTYAALARRARAIGATLAARGQRGERALMVFEEGLDYLDALFGCLYAGKLAVPVHPPDPGRLARTLPRLLNIARDAQIQYVLTTRALADLVRDSLAGEPGLAAIPWIAVDTVDEAAGDGWVPPDAQPEDLAYLQYTSGSTADPKGVMVSHGNLLHQLADFDEGYGHGPESVIVSWLPATHDLGLVYGRLMPLYVGCRSVFMSPAAFLARPARWMEAMSRYRGTHSPSPDFGFALAARAPGDARALSLSHVQVLLNGAEPIRQETEERFARAYAEAGLPDVAITHAMGMSEATAKIVTEPPSRRPRFVHLDRGAYERNEVALVPAGTPRARTVASNGSPSGDTRVLIVDPQSRAPLPEGRIGELWVSGRTVAQGYWNNPAATEQIFRAWTIPSGGRPAEGPFLRTGDLAFLHDGELYLCGRLKDVIILRGQNHHPQDIEWAVASAHPAVRPSCAAAFEIDHDGEPSLGLVTEVREAELSAPEDVLGALRAALSEHGLSARTIALLPARALPKTSSGKIQRGLARAMLLQGRLPVLYRWDAGRESSSQPSPPPQDRDLARSLQGAVAELLGLAPEDIELDRPLRELGLDSVAAVRLASALSAEHGRQVTLPQLLEAPGLRALARALGESEQAPSSPLPRLVPDRGAAHEPFPLTDVQRAYWVGRHHGVALARVGTHLYAEIPVDDLDVPALEAAWNRLIARHPMLRAVVTPEGEQRVLPSVPRYALRRHEASELAAVRETLSHQLFSGAEWPLFDLRVVALEGRRSLLCASLDALVLDLASVHLLSRELSTCYRDLDAALPELELTFRDCVLAERALEQTALHERACAYWMGRLDTLPDAPDLPLAADPAALGTPRFERRTIRLRPDRWEALQSLAVRLGVSPTVLISGVYAEVLGAWSRTPRFTLNFTLFHRAPLHPEVDQVVGDFTSLTLLEVDGSDGQTPLGARLVTLQRRMWADLEHRWFGGIRVQQALAARRPAASFPIVITSALGVQSGRPEPFDLYRSVVLTQTPQVWLDCLITDACGQLVIHWDSVVGLFPCGMLDDLTASVGSLLERLADDPALLDAPSVDVLPPLHRERVSSANETSRPRRIGLLHDPLLEQIERQPHRRAVVCPERTLTYGELGAASAALAARLVRAGARAGQPVAVVMDKGWEQIVAVLGILRAGAPYLPIDAGLPPARIAELLAIGEVEQIVTVPRLSDRLDRQVLAIDPSLLSADEAPPHRSGSEIDLAYVIFTSGSTGTPKGVMIDHRGALNTVLDLNARYGLTTDDAVLGLSSLSFDLSVYDIFGVLGAGGTLVLPAPSEDRDPEAWLQALHAHGVTVWNTVPALLEMLVSAAPRGMRLPLRLILLSGDWIAVDLPDRVRAIAPQAEVVSLGGATEASIWSIAYPIGAVDPGWRSIPYGKALANQRMYVLKPDLALAPIGVVGEIYIGGIGLALGYWRDPIKTAQRFVAHPGTGERLYRTGDLGRLLPDGHIELLGRDDNQVKVGGHRIELGEIEARLEAHPRVHRAVVTAPMLGGKRQLVGYVVADPAWTALPSWVTELIGHLEAQLPDYMVPRTLRAIESLPLSANGKVDRNALPAPEASAPAEAPASTEQEALLTELVAELLGIERISAGAHFFESGGNSLVAVKLVVRLRDAHGLELPLREIFRRPILRDLAALIASSPKTGGALPLPRRFAEPSDEEIL